MAEARGISAGGKGGRKGRAKGKARAPEKAAAAPRKPGTQWWIYAAAAALALYLAFQVYAPALSGPFVFDDTYQPYHTPDFPNRLALLDQGRPPAAHVQLLDQLSVLASAARISCG